MQTPIQKLFCETEHDLEEIKIAVQYALEHSEEFRRMWEITLRRIQRIQIKMLESQK